MTAPVAATTPRDAGGVVGTGAPTTPEAVGLPEASLQGPQEVRVATPYGSIARPAASAADLSAGTAPLVAATATAAPAVPSPLSPVPPTTTLPTPMPLPPPLFVRVGFAPAATVLGAPAEHTPQGGPSAVGKALAAYPTAAAATAAAQRGPTGGTTPLPPLLLPPAAAPAAAAATMVAVAQEPPLPRLPPLPVASTAARATDGGIPLSLTPPLTALAAPNSLPLLETTAATSPVGVTTGPPPPPPPQTKLPAPAPVTGVAPEGNGPVSYPTPQLPPLLLPPQPAAKHAPAALVAVATAPVAVPAAPEAAAIGAVPVTVAWRAAAAATTRPGEVGGLAAGGRARRGLLRIAGQRLAAAVAALRTDEEAGAAATRATAAPGRGRAVKALA